MREIDLDKLYEFEHNEDYSMTPEQVRLNLAKKFTRLDIMEKLHNIKPQEDDYHTIED
jgi:hypothetical protein